MALRQVNLDRTLGWAGRVPRSVVVAADGSAAGDAALRAAGALVAPLGAELHVAPAPEVGVLAGDLPDPLVCLPASPPAHRRRPALGPTSATVLRDVGAPLLLVGPACRDEPTCEAEIERAPKGRDRASAEPGRILVYVDGSTASRVATTVANAWAGRLGLDLWLLGVVSPGGNADLRAADVELLASGHLALLARQVARAGGQAQWDVLHGSSPASAIADHARRSEAGLLVLGVDGRVDGPLAAMVAQLVEQSPAPVLLVPESLTEPLPDIAAPPSARPRPVPVLVRVPDLAPARRRGGGRKAAVVAGVVAALAFASANVTVPYYSIRPGTAIDGHVRVEGAPNYPPEGRIVFITASVRRATLAGLLRGWLDADIDVVPAEGAPIGLGHQAELLNARLMTTSKSTALSVALRRLGYDRAPIRARIDSGHVGGPSAGLAFTLAILDQLTPGALTGGRTVAVTGTITPVGTVGPVGAVAQKVVAARRAGAEVMLVPGSAYAEALRHRGTMAIVPVGTLTEALAALLEAGGDPL